MSVLERTDVDDGGLGATAHRAPRPRKGPLAAVEVAEPEVAEPMVAEPDIAEPESAEPVSDEPDQVTTDEPAVDRAHPVVIDSDDPVGPEPADASTGPGTEVDAGPTRSGRGGLRRMAGIVPTVVSILLVLAMWAWVAGDRDPDAGTSGPGAAEPVDAVPDSAQDAAAVDDVGNGGGEPAAAPDSADEAPAAPGPRTGSSAAGPVGGADVAVWYPVVDVLEGDDLDRTGAENQALAVTALGYPVTVVESEALDGLDPGDWALVGEPQDSLDDALATCEGLSLLPTCAANREVD